MIFPFGETITVIRPSSRDRVGDRTAAETTHTIDGCGIGRQSRAAGQASSKGVNSSRETAETTVELYLPFGADLRFGDRVRLPGDDTEYQVDGLPWAPHHPMTGWDPGVTARLKGVS